jgi:hypothetical protein
MPTRFRPPLLTNDVRETLRQIADGDIDVLLLDKTDTADCDVNPIVALAAHDPVRARELLAQDDLRRAEEML